MKKISSFKLYPFLLAIYPILALWNFNVIYVNFGSAFRTLALALLVTAILWLVFTRIFRDSAKAGLLTTVGTLLFFSYGHLYLYLRDQTDINVRHSYLLAFFGIVFLLAGFLIVRRLRKPTSFERFLSTTGLVLVGFSILQLAWYQFQVYQASVEARENVGDTGVTEGLSGEMVLPDVYLIILDAHTSSNVLKNYFDFDNSEFTDSLTDMGFYVADCAQSNYPSTKFSLFSVMNLNYIQDLLVRSTTLAPLNASVVAETLKAYDYTVVAFENRARGHFDLMEDIRLARNPIVLENTDLFSGINEFESMLIETSLLRLMIDLKYLIPEFITGDVKDSENFEHYLQTHFILDELTKLPEMEGPKFVFTHLMVPHDPFIFTSEGEYEHTTFKEDAIKGYRNNVAFIDNHLPEVLNQIIEKSEVPPVIVVMGDHGPMGKSVTPEQRMSILNAFYVNDDAKGELYDTISPVNSFRIIFNHHFGADFPLLEDVSYHVYGQKEFADPTIIPNVCGE